MKDLINQKKEIIEHIKENREAIALKKKEKAVSRSMAWVDATGTAKEKEDFVRSKVAGLDEDILKLEAEIEYWYNLLNIIEDEMIYE